VSETASAHAATGSPSGSGRWLLLAYAVSGAAALAYEVAWLRELSTMLGATAYASGVMLAAFMTGLGLGTILGAWISRRSRWGLRDAARAELAVAAFSVFALLGIRYLPGVYFDLMKDMSLSGTAFIGLQFAASFVVMLLPTVAMGTTYPLIIEAVGRRDVLGSWAGRLYSVNTAGAIVGSLLAGFVLIPSVGVKGCLIAAAVLSVFASAVFWVLATRLTGAPSMLRSPEAVIAPLALVAVALVPAVSGPPLGIGQIYYFDSSAEYDLALSSRKILFEDEGIYSRVTVAETGAGLRTLSNGALDEGTNSDVDRTTTTMLAVVPAASSENTDSALVVGLGTGYTSQTYQRLGYEHVVTVEINPEVVPASEHFVGPIPENDPRWEVVVDDARAHILTSDETYDTITSEPSWPWSSGVAALFTQEFMEAAKSRLAPGGAYCQWLPNYVLQPKDVEMMYKTMRQVFPRVDVWAINFPDDAESELLLIGHVDDRGLAVDRIGRRIAQLSVPFAKENPLVTPATISVYSDTAALEEALDDPSVPLNTDDHSSLEYRVFWNFVNNALDGQATRR